MTPEELEKLIIEGTPKDMAGSLEGLDETARRCLSRTASTLLTRIRRGELEPRRRGLLSGSRDQNQWTNATIAMLGVCPLSQVKRADFFQDYRHRDALVKILDDRRPAWADEWISHCLEQDFPLLRWETVRELVDRGVCAKPTSPGYTALFVHGFNALDFRNTDDYVPLSERLTRHPEFLDDEIWRLFECEHNGFSVDYVGRSPNTPENYETWPDAIAALAARGLLDRERALDGCLSAQWLTTNSPILSGFQTVHDRLAPEASQLAAREATYRELLGHQVAHVVGFALKQLARIEKTRALERQALVAALPPVFALRQKSHPMAALRLLQRAVKSSPILDDAVTALLLDALRHSAGDVQERAVSILEAHPDLSDAVRSQLARELEEVGARARPRLTALLGDAARNNDDATQAATNEEDGSLRDAVRGLAPAVREHFAISEQDLVQGTLPAPMPRWGLTPGTLDVLRAIPPIADVDSLMDAVAHAIEVVESVQHAEQIIDGIARLCHERPPGFAERAAPLVSRIKTSEGSEGSRGLAGFGVPPPFRDLVLTWLIGTRAGSTLPGFMLMRGPVRFVDARLRELNNRVASGKGAILLSAPTHAGGWIAPMVLVQRARQLGQLPPLATDVVQALLRLSPDGAGAALLAASELTGPLGHVLRLALGGEVTSAASAPVAWWLAAARARWPTEDVSERIRGCGVTVDWPDVLRPATYTWNTRVRTSRAHGLEYSHKEVQVKVTPPLPGLATTPDRLPPVGTAARLGRLARQVGEGIVRGTRLAGQRARARQMDLGSAFPTALFHESEGRWWNSVGNQLPWLLEWQASVWPANADGYFARGVRAMCDRIDMDSSSTNPNHAYLIPLFETDRPWTEMAALAATVALASKDADCRRLAMDALIEGIGDGRAHAQVLAPVVIGLQGDEWMKLNRLAQSLGEVARVSALHRLVCAQILEAWLASLESLPRSSHHLLELLNELLVDLGRGLPADAHAALECVKGASKTAKLARILLQRETTGPGAGERDAVTQAMAARLERARRFSG